MREVFKGIEFIRISSLPEEQRQRIWHSLRRDKIIKIVKDQAVLNDCILYNDYVSWLNAKEDTFIPPVKSYTASSAVQQVFSKLALK